MEQRSAAGIPIDAESWKGLVEAAALVGVSPPSVTAAQGGGS
jgi:hypothetical protein